MSRVLTCQREILARSLPDRCTTNAALVNFASRPGAFALESLRNASGYGRFSIFGCEPIRRLRIRCGGSGGRSDDALAQLASVVECSDTVADCGAPFVAGWVGHISYEAGAELENVRRSGGECCREPILDFALYDGAAVYDHDAGHWHILAVDLAESTAPATARLDRLAALVTGAPAPGSESFSAFRRVFAPPPIPTMTRREYAERVERAIRYISAGDIYQVNLTQCFTTTTDADPLQLYLNLRMTNPADFAAFLPSGGRTILSSSPELFLDLRPDRRVVTRPIKGTRPRAGDSSGDAARRAELLASEKERAELNMIIDLLRNDLGRVCEFGTVRVLADSDVEVHPSVLHLVGTIEGRLAERWSRIDLLRATLPGGSITGCPKIRAMQIINELEPTPRGVYCGSIGYIGLDGHMVFNIAIRTMVHDAGRIRIHAGGAITADSDPVAEYRETLAKAEGMFRALGHSTAAIELLHEREPPVPAGKARHA